MNFMIPKLKEIITATKIQDRVRIKINIKYTKNRNILNQSNNPPKNFKITKIKIIYIKRIRLKKIINLISIQAKIFQNKN